MVLRSPTPSPGCSGWCGGVSKDFAPCYSNLEGWIHTDTLFGISCTSIPNDSANVSDPGLALHSLLSSKTLSPSVQGLDTNFSFRSFYRSAFGLVELWRRWHQSGRLYNSLAGDLDTFGKSCIGFYTDQDQWLNRRLRGHSQRIFEGCFDTTGIWWFRYQQTICRMGKCVYDPNLIVRMLRSICI